MVKISVITGITGQDGSYLTELLLEKDYRPCEVDFLLGDSSKARKELGWKPEITFDELVYEMVENDCK